MSDKITALRHLHLKIATAITHTVLGDKVPEGERWFVETNSVYNDTTDNADCIVGIKSHSTKFPIYYFKDITNGEWAKKFMRLWLFPGERIYFDWSGIVATERLQMSCHGIRRYFD